MKLLQATDNQAATAIEHTTLIEKSHEMRETLAGRKLMERAKGYLMRSKKLTEEGAFNSFSGSASISGSRCAQSPRPCS